MAEQEPPLKPIIDFIIEFDDGSVFELPVNWQDTFVDKFGFNKELYPGIAERLRFVAGKYHEHRAWPSKFDGLFPERVPEGYDAAHDSRYDFDEYYGERWDYWDEPGRQWGEGYITSPPALAQVAEGVMYQNLRSLLMQKALQNLGSSIIVMTPEQFFSDVPKQ